MGLDLTLIDEECPHCKRSGEIASFNYTYNVSRMWYAIYPEDKGMVFIEGMKAFEAQVKLSIAIAALRERKEEMIKLNPPNGWGDYEGFLAFLNELVSIGISNPNAVWRSWR